MQHASTIRLSCIAGAALALLIGFYSSTAHAQGVTREIFRLYNPSNHDHMSSTNQYEASPYYHAESSMFFYVTGSATTGTPCNARPIYRCRVGYDHMESPASNCEGYPNEGVLGYLCTSATSGHQALYRCRTYGGGEHFNSTNSGCEGHIREFTLGYGKPGYSYHANTMADTSGTGDCMGRCGLGCSWMPWESYTSACYEHDLCVQQHGHLACLPSLFKATVSYVLDGAVQLIKSVAHAIKSIFDWF